MLYCPREAGNSYVSSRPPTPLDRSRASMEHLHLYPHLCTGWGSPLLREQSQVAISDSFKAPLHCQSGPTGFNLTENRANNILTPLFPPFFPLASLISSLSPHPFLPVAVHTLPHCSNISNRVESPSLHSGNTYSKFE